MRNYVIATQVRPSHTPTPSCSTAAMHNPPPWTSRGRVVQWSHFRRNDEVMQRTPTVSLRAVFAGCALCQSRVDHD